MITKELIDSRWKILIGAVLSVVIIILGAVSFDLIRQALTPEQLQSVSNAVGQNFASALTDYNTFLWNLTFNLSGDSGIVMVIIAALLGASLIAGEVNKQTIFLLLSRPLSRNRILLTKYAVDAAILLGLTILSGATLYIVSVVSGRPQNLGGLATSILLFWLGTLFVFGVATLLSTLFNDVLRPLGLTVVVLILLNLVGLFPHGSDWSIPSYWSSLPAYLGQEFPLKAFLISLVAALVPVALAFPLFRRQQY
ncbi:MAG TPA: ABC transporter permease subunit [Chloroflexia bacterium]|nr:ABC transporter permease subunit [Chloroflexia bacterium]